VRSHGRIATVAFDGDLDLSTLPIARRALAEAEASGAQQLVLDLGSVDFFDLSGLRVLFEAHERWRSNLQVVHGSDHVDQLVEFSGLERVLQPRSRRRTDGPGRD